MKRSVRWLADNGYRIRLFAGDNLWDGSVAAEILPTCGSTDPISSRYGPLPEP